MNNGLRQYVAGAMLTLAALLASGCQTAVRRDGTSGVSEQIQSRFGAELGQQVASGEPLLPTGVALEDGISEDEAVRTALWNNAAYQELLAQLGFTNAQLLNAGLISDPQFMLYLPIGPRSLKRLAIRRSTHCGCSRSAFERRNLISIR